MDEDDTKSTDDPNLRNSEDKVTNARGKELIDLCKFNKLVVMNGRKNGDIFGKFTCHNWNGSSVVDYFLSSISYIDRICSFVVGDYIPWLFSNSLRLTENNLIYFLNNFLQPFLYIPLPIHFTPSPSGQMKTDPKCQKGKRK